MTLSLFATLPACCCAAGNDKKRKVPPSSPQSEKHRRERSDRLSEMQPKPPSRLDCAPATSSGSRSAPAAGWASSGAASAGGNPAASAGCASSCSAPAVGSSGSGSSSAPKARGSGSSSAPKARGSVGVQLARESVPVEVTHPNTAECTHAECPYGPITDTLLEENVKIIQRLKVIEQHLGL